MLCRSKEAARTIPSWEAGSACNGPDITSVEDLADEAAYSQPPGDEGASNQRAERLRRQGFELRSPPVMEHDLPRPSLTTDQPAVTAHSR